ncbi:hypothetical protein DFQ27_008022 [Actinomortierella ambigua]|uniref:F-box domain-containing protein n=1 Tax=Actinomortierella ambigua TaxID=1343610 RepID=A0A9P6PSA7_9FUNG|nr:hypothetical protein DFQ27_008022 [Actinomortierella ambigua]
MAHPLLLPEIASLIAKHLSLSSRKACALVSRQWHDNWQPSVWETLVIRFKPEPGRRSQQRSHHKKRFVAMLDCVHKNARWIKYLHREVLGDIGSSRATLFRFNLIWIQQYTTSLETFEAHVWHDDDWELCKAIVHANRQLTRVALLWSRQMYWARDDLNMDKIFLSYPSGPSSALSLSSVTHQGGLGSYRPRLRKLTMEGRTDAASLTRVLEACPSIEEVTLDHLVCPFVFEDDDAFIGLSSPWIDCCDEDRQDGIEDKQDRGFNNIIELETVTSAPRLPLTLFPLKSLTLTLSITDPGLFDLLGRCPWIEALSLSVMSRWGIYEALSGPQPLALPHLTQLAILTDNMHLRMIPDRVTDVILRLAPLHQLRELFSAEPTNIPLLVERQHRSLEKVRTEFAQFEATPSIANMLSTCPRLKELHAQPCRDTFGYFIDIRLFLASPWVCTELESLIVTADLRDFSDQYPIDDYAESEKAAEEELVLQERRMNNSCNDMNNCDDDDDVSDWMLVQRVFLKRLGQLKHLRVLRLLSNPDDDSLLGRSLGHMEWSLENGLRHLEDMPSLEVLSLGSMFSLELDVVTLQFMKQHWPNLRLVEHYDLECSGSPEWRRAHWPELMVSKPGESSDTSSR